MKNTDIYIPPAVKHISLEYLPLHGKTGNKKCFRMNLRTSRRQFTNRHLDYIHESYTLGNINCIQLSVDYKI